MAPKMLNYKVRTNKKMSFWNGRNFCCCS